MRDLVRTAFERPDEKRTNPGAATLLREMSRAGVSIHILSGSPEQMRGRLEDKLRLDGIRWDSFVLKPNLQNLMRFRFRAVRDQLGYKLPSLLKARSYEGKSALGLRETLFGDDAEADAFVYSLYADVVAGRVDEGVVARVCERGRVYEDVAKKILDLARTIEHEDAVERVLIHLDQQTPPNEFDVYGPRVVPFYNYLQATFVIHEDGRIPAESVLRVASELVTQHRFDGDALARSYADVGKRGHLAGTKIDEISAALETWLHDRQAPAKSELTTMVERLPAYAKEAQRRFRSPEDRKDIDYLNLVESHNRRRDKRNKRDGRH